MTSHLLKSISWLTTSGSQAWQHVRFFSHTSSCGRKRPLDGIRVIDLSSLLPGPYATQMLGDLGAEVIKIESPSGDGSRFYPPRAPDGSSLIFHAINRGKRSVMLDLKQKDSQWKFWRMLDTADVLVESFRPGVLERLLNLRSIRDLEERYPSLIICRISGYGQTGPMAQMAGHDINYCARAGILGLMKEPHPLPVQVADLCGGSWPAALQIIAALYGRDVGHDRYPQNEAGAGSKAKSADVARKGRGCVIDVSMADGAHAMGVLSFASSGALGYSLGGGKDILAGGVPSYGVYETRDGKVAVGALEEKFWNALCKILGLPKSLGKEGLAQGKRGEVVRRHLQTALRAWRTEDLVDSCDRNDVPVNKVNTVEETMALQDYRNRGLILDIKIGTISYPIARPPLQLVPKLGCEERGPTLGQNNKDY